MTFPANFDVEKQRAIRTPDGVVAIIDIPATVLAIPFIEPSEGADPFAGRIERAKRLAAKGAVIDTQVDIWGWGAKNTHRLRREYGNFEVPAAFGDAVILTAPEVE